MWVFVFGRGTYVRGEVGLSGNPTKEASINHNNPGVRSLIIGRSAIVTWCVVFGLVVNSMLDVLARLVMEGPSVPMRRVYAP